MKIACPPGVRCDDAIADPEPFWFWSSNVRWRRGQPETIGLYAPVLNTGSGDQVTITLDELAADIYTDRNMVVVGHGAYLSIIDWVSGDIEQIHVPDAGSSGRWWFASSEDGIVAGRANITGAIQTINRADRTVTPLSGAPAGAYAGGILAGLLILAGVESFLPDASRKMVVRWSARRTDPSSSGGPGGPFGFEDWTPSDLNSSGEVPLENGSTIVGGGQTQFGFVVWTDTHMHMFTPRTDNYAVGEKMVASAGLLDNKTWVEFGGRIWWYDPNRTLNVYDGGAAQQVPNPIRTATVETIREDMLGRCSLAALPGEVILSYPDAAGIMHAVVYNHEENAWYPWSLNQVAWSSSDGPRPGLVLDADGRLWNHDLHETLPDSLLDPESGEVMEPPAPPPGPMLMGLSVTPFVGEEEDEEVLVTGTVPQPYAFFLMTNQFTPGDMNLEALRARNITVPHTLFSSLTPPPEDAFKVCLRSFGSPDIMEVPFRDEQMVDFGVQVAHLRAGGKRLQLVISAAGVSSMLRFGVPDLDAEAVSSKR